MRAFGTISSSFLLAFLIAGCSAGGGSGSSGDGDGDAIATTGGNSPVGDGDGTMPGVGGGASTGGTGGTPGGTGGGMMGTGGEVGGVDCASLPVCDGFDGAAVDAGTWTNILGYGNDVPAANIALDSSQFRSSPSSLKVTPSGTLPVGVSAAPPGDSLYLRAWIKTEGAVAGSLLAVGDASDHGQEIRLRVRDGYVTLNSAGGGDGLAPDPSGCSPETCIQPPTDWFCAEMFFDLSSESATLWIDGVEAASVAGNVGWHSSGSFPTPGRVWFGSLAPTGGPPTAIYYDDIAVGTSRIGCN